MRKELTCPFPGGGAGARGPEGPVQGSGGWDPTPQSALATTRATRVPAQPRAGRALWAGPGGLPLPGHAELYRRTPSGLLVSPGKPWSPRQDSRWHQERAVAGVILKVEITHQGLKEFHSAARNSSIELGVS